MLNLSPFNPSSFWRLFTDGTGYGAADCAAMAGEMTYGDETESERMDWVHKARKCVLACRTQSEVPLGIDDLAYEDRSFETEEFWVTSEGETKGLRIPNDGGKQFWFGVDHLLISTVHRAPHAPVIWSQAADRRCHTYSALRQTALLAVLITGAYVGLSWKQGISWRAGAIGLGSLALYAWARHQHQYYAQMAGYDWAVLLVRISIAHGEKSWKGLEIACPDARDPLDGWARSHGEMYRAQQEHNQHLTVVSSVTEANPAAQGSQ